MLRRDQALRFFSSWDERNAAMMASRPPEPRGLPLLPYGRKGTVLRSPDPLAFFRRVALDPAPDGSDPGGILALRDRDGDGRADEQVRFSDHGGNGIAFRFGQLFFAPS